MPKAISLDLRERILKAYDKGGVTRQEVAERFDVSLGMVKKLIQQRKRIGDISAQNFRSGAKPKITQEHRQILRELIGKKPDMTLEELKAQLQVDCTIQALHYVLADMGMSYKKRLSEHPNKTGKT